MKYKHWDEYSDAKRWEVSKKEAALETNNGTTKEDLNNIIKFLVQIADPYATEDLEDETLHTRLQERSGTGRGIEL